MSRIEQTQLMFVRDSRDRIVSFAKRPYDVWKPIKREEARRLRMNGVKVVRDERIRGPR